MTAEYIVADVLDGLATLETGSVDLVVTSPPFLALRSYLPADHPDKGKEMGSEATPAAFIDGLLAVMAELRRVVAAHGSVCVELGDTYAGGNSEDKRGGEGNIVENWKPNPYGSATITRGGGADVDKGGAGWPLAKSLSLIPESFRFALAYGFNPHTGAESPAGKWRIRNVIRWVRPNPPVGALGDKWRPATSELVVATVSGKRFWDDLATRRQPKSGEPGAILAPSRAIMGYRGDPNAKSDDPQTVSHIGGAPLLDWWEIPLLEGEEPQRRTDAPKPEGRSHARIAKGAQPRTDLPSQQRDGNWNTLPQMNDDPDGPGAPLLDWWEIPPGGYTGSHYAVFPPELVEPCVKAMCPTRVCVVCGEPSRRIVATQREKDDRLALARHIKEQRMGLGVSRQTVNAWFGYEAGIQHWEALDDANAAVPSPTDWPLLKDRLRLSDQFDGLVLGDRSWTESLVEYEANGTKLNKDERRTDYGRGGDPNQWGDSRIKASRILPDGWSDCGHDSWRPGKVLDPFAGSGTTLLVADALGYDAVGIDIDETNRELWESRKDDRAFTLRRQAELF